MLEIGHGRATLESPFAGVGNTAIGDQSRDQPRGGHIEGWIESITPIRRQLHLSELTSGRARKHPTLNRCHLSSGPGLDGDFSDTIIKGPINGGSGQRHVEGHMVVVRSEGFQISADLVAHIATAGGAVGATITASTSPCCIR